MGSVDEKKLNNSTEFMTQSGVTRHTLIMISDQRKQHIIVIIIKKNTNRLSEERLSLCGRLNKVDKHYSLTVTV